jgi:hypothetical protein
MPAVNEMNESREKRIEAAKRAKLLMALQIPDTWFKMRLANNPIMDSRPTEHQVETGGRILALTRSISCSLVILLLGSSFRYEAHDQ